jgi:hypothetical protein
MRATTSFSTKKLQAIIDDLSGEVDKVDKLGPIVEARIARGERENSEEERHLAGLERMENRRERQVAAQFREKVLVEQEVVQQGMQARPLKYFEILTFIHRTILLRDEQMAREQGCQQDQCQAAPR